MYKSVIPLTGVQPSELLVNEMQCDAVGVVCPILNTN